MAVTNHSYCIQCTDVADTLSGRLYVSMIRWVAGASAGDEVILKDSDGKRIWHSEADGADFIDVSYVFRWVNGLAFDSLDSGIVYVYTE